MYCQQPSKLSIPFARPKAGVKVCSAGIRMLLSGPRSHSLASSLLFTGVSNLARAAT